MSWRAITEDDLRSVINVHEDTALREALLASGQEDPFVTNAAKVTGYFRNAIRSGPGNTLDTDETTLPVAAIMHACGMLAFQLFKRFAAELMTDDHRQANKDAEAWLKEVRAGREKIEQPGEETATPSGGSLEQITPARRRADRQGLAGL
jgi:hypothetical protein